MCALASAVMLMVAGQQARAAPSKGPLDRPLLASEFRDGANHHLGDDSFVATFKRLPTTDDAEALRMHTHLMYVHSLLAHRAATSPRLAVQRQQLLGALGDYIAAGVTPHNHHVDHRSPVFIDDEGHICAVGYLIERSVGREVAEAIAATHRYDYLEDIAAAMPQVRAWIASSGFTLTELASIQPGYIAEIDLWQPWEKPTLAVSEHRVEDEPSVDDGKLARSHMQGKWTRVAAHGTKLGEGTFVNGRGTWRSYYRSGTLMAEGGYRHDAPAGLWKIYHPSGRIAAHGKFVKGVRDGRWQFFHDDDAHTLIAEGAFAWGGVWGTWKHYDQNGAVFATADTRTPDEWGERSTGGHFLSIRPFQGVQFQSQQTDMGAAPRYLATLFETARHGERIYMTGHSDFREDGTTTPEIYDAQGNQLVRGEQRWQATPCGWPRAQRRAAAAGDLSELSGRFEKQRPDFPCVGKATSLDAARSQRIDALFAAHDAQVVPAPQFVSMMRRPVETSNTADGADGADGADAADEPENMINVLDSSMGWYIEWPHIDRPFVALYATLPGYSTR